jgi:DnaJ-domain-containing protein 1
MPVAFVREDREMALPRDSFHMQVQSNVLESWQQLVRSMEESLNLLEKGLDEASAMRQICTDEWCVATEHVLDELSNGLFSISEPRWASEEDAKKLRALKRKVHDLYGKYKAVSQQ